MTAVYVGSSTHTTTYVATNLLRSLRTLIRSAGLDPAKFMSTWSLWEDGVAHWLGQRGLEQLVLEVFDPSAPTDSDFRGRFDFTLSYTYSGDGELWVDPDLIAFAIKKNGSYPSTCRYKLMAVTAMGATDPPTGSWTSTSFRSTAGFTKHNAGTSVAGGSTSASLTYYRKAN